MLYLQLLWSFIKIGFTSFGGLSMIPLITSEVLGHGWLTAQEVTDLIAIAEMTPGPLGLNSASFAGVRVGGFPGAIVATLGAVFPTLTVTAFAGFWYDKFKTSTLMVRIMTGVRPVCLGLVAGICLSLTMTNYVLDGQVSVLAILIGLVDYFLLARLKKSIPFVICVSAVAGMLCFHV